MFVETIGDESFEDGDYVDESKEESIDFILTVSDVDDTSDEEVQDARRAQLDDQKHKNQVKCSQTRKHDQMEEPQMNEEEMEEIQRDMHASKSDGYTSDTENEPDEWTEAQKKIKKKFKMVNTISDMKNVKLFIGLTFPNAQVLREAMRKYGLDKQIDTSFTRNEGKRIVVECANSKNCP